MTAAAYPVWEYVGFLHQMQFPWRLMPVCLLMAAGACAVALQQGSLRYKHVFVFTAVLLCGEVGIQVLGAVASIPGGPLPAQWAMQVTNRVPQYVRWTEREDLN